MIATTTFSMTPTKIPTPTTQRAKPASKLPTANFSSPSTAPKKIASPGTKAPFPATTTPSQTPAKSPTKPTHKAALYAHPHVTSPCTLGALTHRLNCTHLVLTPSPQPCARNCHEPEGAHAAVGIRNLDSCFACPVCIATLIRDCSAKQKVAFEAKVALAADAAKRGSGVRCKDGECMPVESWVRRRSESFDRAMGVVMEDKKGELLAKGRAAHAVYMPEELAEWAPKVVVSALDAKEGMKIAGVVAMSLKGGVGRRTVSASKLPMARPRSIGRKPVRA